MVQVVADWDDTTLLPHEAAAWLSKDTAGAAAGPCRHILGFHPHGLYPSGFRPYVRLSLSVTGILCFRLSVTHCLCLCL